MRAGAGALFLAVCRGLQNYPSALLGELWRPAQPQPGHEEGHRGRRARAEGPTPQDE